MCRVYGSSGLFTSSHLRGRKYVVSYPKKRSLKRFATCHHNKPKLDSFRTLFSRSLFCKRKKNREKKKQIVEKAKKKKRKLNNYYLGLTKAEK